MSENLIETGSKRPKFTFVNIIFFVLFGVFTGVLWAYASPVPLIPGQVHFRTFAFVITAIGLLFGPVSGFFAGYIGTLVWALLGGYFIPLHSPLADGITVGLSAALPSLVMLGRGKTLDDLIDKINAGKGKFIGLSLFWSVFFGILMIVTTSLSLAYFTTFTKEYYFFCVTMIGIADVLPIAITPFVVVPLASRLKRVQTILPRI